jgi:hypothetical protein
VDWASVPKDALSRYDSTAMPRRADDDDHLVHATWNRRFWGFTILAFADHTYEIDIGSANKPPMISFGWCRWYPCAFEFPRLRRF